MAKGKRHGGTKTESVSTKNKVASKQVTVNSHPWSARNLLKKDLAGVIFVCKQSTFNECMTKKLFGLPGAHIAYVQNVTPGMPLFLFNCTDRKIFGIFEAVSSGQLNIDRHAWVSDEFVTTPFPAQVRVTIQNYCKPLSEKQFKPIIIDNYHKHDPHYFWFELDRNQTDKLKFLLATNPISQSNPSSPVKWGHLLKRSVDEITRQQASSSTASLKGKEVVKYHGNSTSWEQGKSWSSLFKPETALLEEESEDCDGESLCTSSEKEPSVLSEPISVNENSIGIPEASNGIYEASASDVSEENSSEEVSDDEETGVETNSEICAFFDKLLETVGEIKDIQLTQTQKIEKLDLELAEVNNRLKQLESHQGKSGSSSRSSSDDGCDSILLVGGFDGSSWLRQLVSYIPSQDMIQFVVPMTSDRPYASSVELNGEVFVLGGGGQGTGWYDTVEAYNHSQRQWVTCPNLSTRKGSLAGASLNGKIFAIGGGNATGCLSEVEMLDFNVGRWMTTRSMLSQRFSAAAAELNGALYVAGGYDGHEYLSSVERYDPRAYSWMRLENLSSRRSCHTLAVLNDKLYAIGGYDGDQMVPTVEVFEPRVGSWTMSEPLTCPRGYLGTATLGNTIYAIGGMKNANTILNTIECYSAGEGWQLTDSKCVGKRCFFSAVACNI